MDVKKKKNASNMFINSNP